MSGGLLEGWDYDIDRQSDDNDEIWKIKWDLPCGLTLTATVTFDGVEYCGQEKEVGEAWGAPYRHTHDSYTEVEGGEVSAVSITGEHATGTLALSDKLKAAIVGVVQAHVERTIQEEGDSEAEEARKGGE